MKTQYTYSLLFIKAFFWIGILFPPDAYCQSSAYHARLVRTNNIRKDKESKGSVAEPKAVYFSNSRIGFSIDQNGNIRKTIDGGANWTLIKIKTRQTIRGIHFPVVNVGYAVGDSGLILKTVNGGKQWQRLNGITSRNLHSVYFENIHSGYAMGEAGTILKTTDGGETWKHLGTNCSLSGSPEGTTFILNKVYFNKSKYDLLAESFAELDTLVKFLIENPSVEIEVSGHTDNQGEMTDNFILSENRAKAVKEYLVSKKINQDRIRCKGYGETKPIASNASEQTRKLNRRVEFMILKR